MTDSTPGGFADTPGPDSTPEQDADVRSLLAFLRDEPVEMPPEVELRLYAVLDEERRTAPAALGGPSAAVGSTDAERGTGAPGIAPVTVLPTRPARRGPSTRVLQVVGGLAAAVVAVVGAVTLLGTHPGGSFSASSTAGGASAAPTPAVAGATGTLLTASGTGYTKATLRTQVAGLVAAARTSEKAAATPAATLPTSNGFGTSGSASTPAPAADSSLRAALTSLQAPGAAAACVTRLTGGGGSTALAIDAGTYAGKPALVVVVPTTGDPTSLDVFVVTLDCSPTFLEFQRVPAS